MSNYISYEANEHLKDAGLKLAMALSWIAVCDLNEGEKDRLLAQLAEHARAIDALRLDYAPTNVSRRIYG